MKAKLNWFKGTWLKWLAHPGVIFHYVKDVLSGKYKGYSVFKFVLPLLALIYVLSPFDFLHDWLVPLGWMDDAAIVAWALSTLDKEMDKYYSYRKQIETQDDASQDGK